ncbi:MAG: hypothetical protein CMP22_07720 [Rickettsiales bacterium]|nr:hypothetical protein [Rickettsiales bacterium]|tara:strand:- start:946 stop:1155 length:210 start_codon:yes stop_codon:yes gene_type:complete
MNIVDTIIEKFGGIRPAARKLEEAPANIQGWLKRGVIPAKKQQKVLDTAKQNGIDLKPADFFSTPVRHS